MKNVLLLIVGIMLAAPTFAQTATSTANGSWLNPSNWDCGCVPLPGYTVTINHAITLNTDFGYSSGSITISMNGSLIQDATPRNMSAGGNFLNRGTVNMHALLISAGTFINDPSGDLTLSAFTNYSALYNYGFVTLDSFYNTSYLNNMNGTIDVGGFLNTGTMHNSGRIQADSFYNSGTINNNADIDVSSFYNANQINNYKNIFHNNTNIGVDSFVNAGTMINYSTGMIVVDSVTNTGFFVNHSLMSFGDFTNWGTTNNYDSLIGARNFWNDGQFHNKPNSRMTLGGSFYNGDTLGTVQIANFKNDGVVMIADSWYSTDTTSGSSSGSFRIQNITSNSGNMIGSFDFCDLTPPVFAPYIDFNIGFVDNNITYCTPTSISTISNNNNVQIFPNPIQNQISINIEEQGVYHLELVNSIGQTVLQQQIGNQEVLDWSNLGNGIYWLRILNEKQEILKVEKLSKI